MNAPTVKSVSFWTFWLAFALVIACGSVGFSQSTQIPLGTNVTTGVSMPSLTLVSPPVQITGGVDQPIPLTVYFRRAVDLGSSNVSVAARFSLEVTVTVRASQVAAVAGVGLAEYDDMSTRAKMQAASALGLQAGLPRLRSALAALYTGSSTNDEVRVSALSVTDPSPVEAGGERVQIDSSDSTDAPVIDIPKAFMDRAAEALGAGIRP